MLELNYLKINFNLIRCLPSLRAPHPITTASLSVYWSFEQAGGKQTGEIVDVNNTGDSIIKMAMSLYCQ